MSTTPVHAFGDDALAEYDAVGLAEEIRARRISPGEVADAAIARAKVVDPQLNALACADFDRARERSWRHDDAFFAGVPTLVKDNVDVAGLPTQQGTSAYVGRPRKADGDWARTYLQLGLVSLGKSQLSEFGFSASAEFVDREPVRNPWATDHTSGASSAGSAAMVATGVVPIAHANDGGGSIRIPAACCGLVGLKPSRARTLSDVMNRRMPVRIVADGVLTRSVRDTAAFYREYEKVHRNVKLRPIGDVSGPGRKRRRIALVVDSPQGPTDAATTAVVRRTGELLEGMGHHVEEVPAPVPAYFADDFLTYWSLLALAIMRGGRRNYGRSFDPDRLDNLTRGLARHAQRNLHRMPLAITRLRASRYVSARFHRNYDLTLTPTLGHTTPLLGHLNPGQSYETIIERLMQWVTFTPLQNATGDPAISLPLGATEDGLPIGVMLGAPCGHESRLLQVAYELEEAVPFRRLGAQNVADERLR